MNLIGLFFAPAPMFSKLDYRDPRNISQSYQMLDIMLTAQEIHDPGLMNRSLWVGQLFSEDLSWEREDGLSVPVGVSAVGNDLALRAVLPFRFAFKKEFLYAYEEVNLFSGRTAFPGLRPWDPRHDPRWEISSWDPQPIVGKQQLLEERQTRGYAGVLWDWGCLSVGREVLRLGPAYRYAMTQSGFAGPLDFFYNLSLRSEKLIFTAAFARIPDTVDNRRLTLQRIDFMPFAWMSLAATEGVYSSRGDFAKYANPFLFFHDIQRHESDNQDNLFASAELSVIPVRGLRLYGEIFMDDPTFISGGEAAQYAGMLGAHIALPYGEKLWSIRIEGAEASPYTYAHFSDSNAMSAMGWPMGYWLGPDARSVFVEMSLIRPVFSAGVWAEAWQHGQLWITDAYEDSMKIITDWPTGVVETGVETGLRLGLNTGFLKAELLPGYYFGDNYQNTRGRTISEFRVSASVEIRHPGAFVGF